MKRIFLIFLLFIIACSRPMTEEQISEDLDNVLGARTSQGDTEILIYPREEIQDNVFLDKRVEVKDNESTLTLNFESNKEITYRETIPKEFAASTDNIIFSVQPRIIEKDPVVEWTLAFEGFDVKGIKMTTDKGKSHVEMFDAFDKQKGFDLCNKLPESSRENCYMIAVGKLKSPKLSDCNIIKSFETKEGCYVAVAGANEDPTICKNIKTREIKSICYAGFAAVYNDKSFCNEIKEEAERQVCLFTFEAHERGMTYDELYREKQEELDKSGLTQEDDLVLDIRIDTDDNEFYTNRQYTFSAEIDPYNKIPDNAVYEFIFDDGNKQKSSSASVTRTFDKTGAYKLTVKVYDGSKLVLEKARTFVFEEGEKKEDSVVIDDCAERAEICAEGCNEICEQTKDEYCEKHDYSGCRLDVFCWCNVCALYDEKWCPNYPDFMSCVEGDMGKYTDCIDNCQSKREAGSDVSTCWNDCNEQLNEIVIECKQPICEEFCKEKGFDNGEWARYTNEYGWDSCYCS